MTSPTKVSKTSKVLRSKSPRDAKSPRVKIDKQKKFLVDQAEAGNESGTPVTVLNLKKEGTDGVNPSNLKTRRMKKAETIEA